MFCFFCQNNNKASKTIIDGGVDFAGALWDVAYPTAYVMRA